MAQHSGVAKAAHALGISRHDLQQLIRSGELHTFEGKLDLDELKKYYPGLCLAEHSLVEDMTVIRNTAFSRRVSERLVPDTEAITTQLKKRMTELAVERGRVTKYRCIVEDLMRLLGQMQLSDDPHRREIIAELNEWLLKKLQH